MRGRISMSTQELKRKAILDAVLDKNYTLLEASVRMGVSYRQSKRILARYKAHQEEGLVHKSCGRLPGNAYTAECKNKVLAIYQSKYLNFGPTFAAEKLLEDDQIPITAETLRLWLKANGLWSKQRRRKLHRERRERRHHFGDLLQIDGSIHQWFIGDERYYCWLNMVDDATGVTMALLDNGETTKILLTVLTRWIENYGIPKAVYVDLKSVYIAPKKFAYLLDEGELSGFKGNSVFQQVCGRLGIEIIKAYSPQAKGRVERKHAIFQDRLVKELALYKIQGIEAANKYLEEKFLPKINDKFVKAPKKEASSHLPADSYGDLKEIICWNYKRKLRNDWTILLHGEYFQLKSQLLLQPKLDLIARIYLDGSMNILYDGIKLEFEKLAVKPPQPSSTKKYYAAKCYDPTQRSKLSTKNKGKSPWSQFNPDWLKNGKTCCKEKLSEVLSTTP